MILQIVKRFLGGVLLLEPVRHVDERGSFTVTYEAQAALELGLSSRFVQDNHSVSVHAQTLRGLHLQLPPYGQAKLVRVLKGRIFDAFVDLRIDSPTFGEYEAIELTDEVERQLWIPAGFAHGFLTLTDNAEVFYKVDKPYLPSAERTLAWDEPSIGVGWPIGTETPFLSAKDSEGHDLESLSSELRDAQL